MDSKYYEYFYTLTKDRSGIILSDEKRYLVDSRLQPIAVAEGLATVAALLAKLQSVSVNDSLAHRCIDAMATHETSFFRDHTPFEQLHDAVIPLLITQHAKKRSLRIWSAACSTGQEAYSIAMTLNLHAAALAGWNIEILGTDLTEDIMAHAKSGRYTGFELHRGLSDAEINRNFRRIDDATWEILPHLKSMVKFRTFNLLDDYTMLGHFDLVFCRNVLIYFDRARKASVLEKIHRVINPEGFLILGSAETVVGLSTDFSVLKGTRGVYQVKPLHVHANLTI